MPKFSKKSQALLDQIHPDLQLVLTCAIKYIDFTVLDSTIRTKEQQAQYVKEGKSKTMDSKHLKKYLPEYEKEYSLAVDIMPYFSKEPHNDWNDLQEFCFLAGYILGIAKVLRSEGMIHSDIVWGGKWSKEKIKENTFIDMPHFEIK